MRTTVKILLASLLGVLLLEGGVRLFYAEPWYQRLLEEQIGRQKKSYRRNRLDLRDRNYDEPKTSATRRVLILGDSFAHGSGVFDEDAIFPEVLEQRLNRDSRLPGVDRVDILNGAIDGSLTSAWLELYREVEDSFDPDLVLFVFFLRDGTEIGSLGAFFGPIRHQIAERNEDSSWYRYCYLYRVVRDSQDRRDIQTAYIERFRRAYFGGSAETAEWRLARKNLLEIRRLAEARGARVGLVVFPVLVELAGDYPFQAICAEILRFCEEAGIPAMNLLDAYRGKQATELWVSSLDQHPNVEGHRIAADGIEPFLLELLKAGE